MENSESKPSSFVPENARSSISTADLESAEDEDFMGDLDINETSSYCDLPCDSNDFDEKCDNSKNGRVDHTYQDYSHHTNLDSPDSNGLLREFPAILHCMLSEQKNEKIVSWMPHGRSWRVHKRNEFESDVLPQCFRHSRFPSFLRQVNNWGFKRITQGRDKNAYYHECFLRGIPHLTGKMKRIDRSSRKIGRKRSDPENEPNFYKLSLEHPLPEHWNSLKAILEKTDDSWKESDKHIEDKVEKTLTLFSTAFDTDQIIKKISDMVNDKNKILIMSCLLAAKQIVASRVHLVEHDLRKQFQADLEQKQRSVTSVSNFEKLKKLSKEHDAFNRALFDIFGFSESSGNYSQKNYEILLSSIDATALAASYQIPNP
mmetsp:Transcript_3222/g.6681  ORF Transcript_3222/g.6681 Transcript_3222/m.6681 type:complete len:373 (+) Transcript_3222:130-1248(+)|eukprot:CAMPEP_0194336644 /NCGR_PEP_ID=MMETSP0171-20130528/73660_1 /TAXON_ID=218684 /ORGANISM="Corethron pennatum, Strain L29A3" /LENGTH=372 /DNA_ID=CAMNT_0039100165 /DNA_START=30 /DNA_END=1148 /DNA_ORIENTATION=-